MSTLKTNYQDAVASGDRKYRITANADGTSGIADATTYSQEGSQIGAADLNATNLAVLANAAGIEAESTRAQGVENEIKQDLAVSCKNNYLGPSLISNGGAFRIQDISIPFNTTEQAANIPFQMPFPNACFGVWLTPQSGYTNYNIGMATENITKNGFQLKFSASASFTIMVKMLAFGY